MIKILLFFLMSKVAYAAPSVKTWINPDCANGDCEVKSMKLYVEKNNSVRYKLAYNQMAAEIETTKPEHLAKYAFVQYIKGCYVQISNLGEIRMGSREFWGRKGAPFLHKTFELDSASDKDPIYWSNNNAGYDYIRGFEIPRNSYYVNDNPVLTESYGSFAGKIKNLKSNKIYASDMPSPSSWQEENGIITANTSSLEFQICLHKIADVPVTVEKPATIIPDPIVCMDWSSNYQFNFRKKTWEEKTALHPACK